MSTSTEIDRVIKDFYCNSLCKNSFVITMEQINNWNILMFISFAHSHIIDGLVTTEPELPKHCQQHAMIF